MRWGQRALGSWGLAVLLLALGCDAGSSSDPNRDPSGTSLAGAVGAGMGGVSGGTGGPGGNGGDSALAGAGSAPLACAANGESCSVTDLMTRSLSGCCDGLVCKLDAAGTAACQSGTPEEIALAARCVAWGRQSFMIDQPLLSDQGELPFRNAWNVSLEHERDGEVSMVSMTLNNGSSNDCSLVLEAGPERDAMGNLVMTSLTISLIEQAGCPSFPAAIERHRFSTIGGGDVVGSVLVDGFSCEKPTRGGYCYAGVLEIRLNGTLNATVVSGADPTERISFLDASMRLDGNDCT